MKDVNGLLKYQIQYLYNFEIQLENLISELEDFLPNTEIIANFTEKRESATRNKENLDLICRDTAIDPRGTHSKILLGFREDIYCLLGSTMKADDKKLALQQALARIFVYREECYKNLIKMAENSSITSIIEKFSPICNYKKVAINVESNGILD